MFKNAFNIQLCLSDASLFCVRNPIIVRLTCYIFSTQVGHVQRVSLVPDRTHNMRTLSLKPLLFGEFQLFMY